MTIVQEMRLEKAMHKVEQGRRRGFYRKVQNMVDGVWEELVAGTMAQDEADGVDYECEAEGGAA